MSSDSKSGKTERATPESTAVATTTTTEVVVVQEEPEDDDDDMMDLLVKGGIAFMLFRALKGRENPLNDGPVVLGGKVSGGKLLATMDASGRVQFGRGLWGPNAYAGAIEVMTTALRTREAKAIELDVSEAPDEEAGYFVVLAKEHKLPHELVFGDESDDDGTDDTSRARQGASVPAVIEAEIVSDDQA